MARTVLEEASTFVDGFQISKKARDKANSYIEQYMEKLKARYPPKYMQAKKDYDY